MLDVFFTVDVEIWCDGWNDLDQKFPAAFNRYVYGATVGGNYGLPYQLKVLADHGLVATFFVEPLFSKRFGSQPLTEIVGLFEGSKQEIQLHLHTEWVDESLQPIFETQGPKRQYLFMFSLQEQVRLIALGTDLLMAAGAREINAFRAGSFGFNTDTLRALAKNQIRFDSSYNATLFGSQSGISPRQLVFQPMEWAGVFEYPMTVFNNRFGGMRHAQLGACSYAELESLLWQALENKLDSFVILSHNFELMNQSKTKADGVVVKRFNKLCDFLNKNRDSFQTRGFNSLQPRISSSHSNVLRSSVFQAGARFIEQAYRRTYS